MDEEAWYGLMFWLKKDGRYYRISQPNLRHNRGRGQSQVGLIYDRDGYAICAFTGAKADDLFSWNTRQDTQEESIEQRKRIFLSF